MEMKFGLRRLWMERRSAVVSAGIHASLLALLLGGFHWSPKVAPYRLPGTETGVRTLTYFSAGNPQPHAIDAPVKDAEVTKKAVDTAHDALQPAKPQSAAAARADAGSGDAVKSGVGEGNITIALQKVFPYPRPDLSSMAHGTSGDVILDAVIDEHGKISALTLLKGLGDPIDKNVIATVEQWSYTPAMKGGGAGRKRAGTALPLRTRIIILREQRERQAKLPAYAVPHARRQGALTLSRAPATASKWVKAIAAERQLPEQS